MKTFPLLLKLCALFIVLLTPEMVASNEVELSQGHLFVTIPTALSSNDKKLEFLYKLSNLLNESADLHTITIEDCSILASDSDDRIVDAAIGIICGSGREIKTVSVRNVRNFRNLNLKQLSSLNSMQYLNISGAPLITSTSIQHLIDRVPLEQLVLSQCEELKGFMNFRAKRELQPKVTVDGTVVPPAEKTSGQSDAP